MPQEIDLEGAGIHDKEANANDPPEDGGIHSSDSSKVSQQKMEDFDDSANVLWSLYVKEAKGHDEATIQTLTKDMNGVLLFAGLFAASLTPFIIDRAQSIQVTPAQQMVFYEQQSVELLKQISAQISSLSAQASVPSTAPVPALIANPSQSDIRVNIFWFISLVLSLSAALLATLVQRWARDHMQIFQRYSHPLKAARIRHYLHEGVKGWHMPAIAEAVPALIHVSLFLFLIGLGDFLLNANGKVGRAAVSFIAVYCGFYIVATVAPVMKPQSPLRSPFSILLWYLAQKLRLRRYTDRVDGSPKVVSTNMAKGQMELAMENKPTRKGPTRKGRDKRAIRWLVGTLTEDIEMESFALGIPGSFNPEWGVEVWRRDAANKDDKRTDFSSDEPPTGPATGDDLPVYKSRPPPPPSRLSTPRSLLGYISTAIGTHAEGNTRTPPNSVGLSSVRHSYPSQVDGIQELCRRIGRLFETCNNRGLFVKDDEWRRRSRACVETAASFKFCMDAKLSWFGDIGKLLSKLGEVEETRKFSATGLNRSFAMSWTCLSIVATGQMLKSKRLQQYARGTIVTLALSHEVDNNPFDTDKLALRNAQEIDEQFATAWGCLDELYQAFKRFGKGNEAAKRVEEILRRYESGLRQIQIEADRMEQIDMRISDLQKAIDEATDNLTRQLPGVAFDSLTGLTPVEDAFHFLVNPVQAQLLYLRQRLEAFSFLTQGRSSEEYAEIVLKTFDQIPTSLRSVVGQHRLMERQLWRLQDLCVGCAFGFTLELYFLAVRQTFSSSPSSSNESHTTFYVGAFKAITSDWEQSKRSFGTLQIILNLVCDIAVRDRGIFSNYTYPSYITDELLKLLANVVEGQATLRPHIDDAVQELQNVLWRHGDQDFRVSALRTILDHRS